MDPNIPDNLWGQMCESKNSYVEYGHAKIKRYLKGLKYVFIIIMSSDPENEASVLP